MNILLRVLLSVMALVLVFAIIDYYIDGALKYILWGITAAVVSLYNEKKNREHRKAKNSKY
ncbi:hypothetical protein [Fredinandcohnia onubensis]|uniref:hypothetical protein n=1 Tax=Fredinandcohnia onubensis TaxID=1571209 RepID=UPI000C0C0C8C|nr:hypothetical protein [Fredinandcohnia onubensis]